MALNSQKNRSKVAPVKATQAKSTPSTVAKGKPAQGAGVDRKLFQATMTQRQEDMAAARSKASGGFIKFPEEGEFYVKLVRIASGVKDNYNWVTPIFEVIHGEYEGQEFSGDFCCNQTDKRATGMWILAQGLTGGNAPDDAEDLLPCYEGCVGNLYHVKAVDNDKGFRNLKIVQEIDGVPEDAE